MSFNDGESVEEIKKLIFASADDQKLYLKNCVHSYLTNLLASGLTVTQQTTVIALSSVQCTGSFAHLVAATILAHPKDTCIREYVNTRIQVLPQKFIFTSRTVAMGLLKRP